MKFSKSILVKWASILCTVIVFFLLSFTNSVQAQDSLMFHFVNAPIDSKFVVPQVMGQKIIGESRSENDVSYFLDLAEPQYLFIIIPDEVKSRWKCRVWLGGDVDSKHITIDYLKKSVVIENNAWEQESLLENSLKNDIYDESDKPDYSKNLESELKDLYVKMYLRNKSNFLGSQYLLWAAKSLSKNELKGYLDELPETLRQFSNYTYTQNILKYYQPYSENSLFQPSEVINSKGEKIELEIEEKQITIIQFYHNGCRYSNEFIVEDSRFIEEYNAKNEVGIEVISLCLDPDFQQFLEGAVSNQISWDKYLVADNWYGELALANDVSATPTILILNKDGHIMHHLTGKSLQEAISIAEAD